MATYVYHCKKNGRTYTYESGAGTVLATPQDQYGWRRGVREYADNYLASCSHPDSKNRKGEPADTAFNGTVAEFHAEIDKLCREAVTRFHAGAVPGENAMVDPLVAVAAMHGISVEQLKALISANKKEASVIESTPAQFLTTAKKKTG